MNFQSRKRLTDLNELTVAGEVEGERRGGRIVREFGMDMNTPPYLKWITNKFHVLYIRSLLVIHFK